MSELDLDGWGGRGVEFPWLGQQSGPLWVHPASWKAPLCHVEGTWMPRCGQGTKMANEVTDP